jgi:hypothetical protein
MDIKENFQIKLNELRGKSSLSDDERKELKDRIRKKHGKAWNDTIGIRKEKKSAGPADTKDMDKFRNRLAKMYNNLEEASAGKIGNYIAKASDQKSKIQGRGYADKLEKGDLRKFEKRKKGVQMAIRKLTGQAKVPAKVKKKESFDISRKTRKDIDDALKRNIGE